MVINDWNHNSEHVHKLGQQRRVSLQLYASILQMKKKRVRHNGRCWEAARRVRRGEKSQKIIGERHNCRVK